MNSKLDNEMKTGPLSLGEVSKGDDVGGDYKIYPTSAGGVVLASGGGRADAMSWTDVPVQSGPRGEVRIAGIGGTSSVAGGACGSISNGGSSWLHDRIQAACQDNLTITTATSAIKMARECVTIGQHIDRRIASLQEQLSVMQGIRSQLEGVGALDLPTQTLRDALY